MRTESDLPKVKFGQLSEPEKKAAEAAVGAMKNSYSPYSKLKVGAAVVSAGGKIYAGANIENAHYKAAHAEESALLAMANAGERKFNIMACAVKELGIPCMSCRQFMREFSGNELDKVIIISIDAEDTGTVIRCTFADIVGVDSFGPRELGVDPEKF